MDIHAIRCFQRVFEKESIHQAAKDLCLTPQGVSRIITALEGEMQTPLFVRSRKGMEATPEGQYFYEHTQELTRQLLDLQLGMQALKRKKKRKSIAPALKPSSMRVTLFTTGRPSLLKT